MLRIRLGRGGRRPQPADAAAVEPFVDPRIFVIDATTEKLAVLLQARPRGIVVQRDELSAIFLNMGRYSNGSDREFWLEAHNGGAYTVERMSRPPVALDHLAVGLVGGMQPDKLARSFEGDEDGMTARFLFAWPTEPNYQPLSDEADEIEPELLTCLQRLVDLVAEDEDGVFAPRTVRFSTDARATFEKFRQLVRRGRSALDGREREWWSKGDGMVLRLAGVLAFLSWSFPVGDSEPTEIGARHLQNAVMLWHDYYWPHARAAMRQIGMTEKHTHARRALLWIRANQKIEVSVQDIRRDALGQRLAADKSENLSQQLCRDGFLREAGNKTTGKRGRPARRWFVNPKLLHVSENAENAENGVRL